MYKSSILNKDIKDITSLSKLTLFYTYHLYFKYNLPIIM